MEDISPTLMAGDICVLDLLGRKSTERDMLRGIPGPLTVEFVKVYYCFSVSGWGIPPSICK